MAQTNDLQFDPTPLTVLIVDDHDPIRKGIKRVLLGMGFREVIECFDGEDALKVLGEKPVDLMILDLYMRNVSGFDVLEHIRNRDIASDMPIIVVTGEASKEEIVKVADMGTEDYVLKPFQAQDLEKKVAKTLNKFFSPSPLIDAVRQAERLYVAQSYKGALAAFDRALAVDGQSPRALHGKALTLDKLGRHAEALELLNLSTQRNVSYHKTYGAIADILLKENRNTDAVDAMKRELAINPKQPNRQVHLARLLLKEGDSTGAVEHYRIALQEDPKRLNALMGMGQAYAMADNLDKALYYFKRVRRYHPQASKALEAAVRCALAANEPRKAEMFLREEKNAHPDRYDAYLLLAMLYLRQEREDEAMALADDLLTRDPENSQALRVKASIQLKRKDYPNALVTLLLVAKAAPSAEVFTTIGESYLNQNNIPNAMEALHRAISMGGDNPTPYLLLADAHRKSQQWLKASCLYRRAAQLGANRERCMAQASECAANIAVRRSRSRAAS